MNAVPATAILVPMTAKERLLREAPDWSEEQAAHALRAVERKAELADYLEAESKLTPAELRARDDAWAAANARETVRDETW